MCIRDRAEAEENADGGIDLEAKPEITYDDFAKLQFQIGEIIACEAVPKSKKLLCSQVKVGSLSLIHIFVLFAALYGFRKWQAKRAPQLASS